MEIPIQNVQAFAEANGLSQLIVFGFDGTASHIATWAADAGASDTLAVSANLLKAALKWPEITQVESAKVIALRARIAELEKQADDAAQEQARPKRIEAFVLECTEYEREWGQRPDGYLIFQTAEDLSKFEADDLRAKRATTETPGYYVAYQRQPSRTARANFFDNLPLDRRYRYVDKLSELG